MRVDDYISTVGLVKRRTIAKKLADGGMIEINGKKAKPGAQVAVNDIIALKGNRGLTVQVLAIPGGSVPKAEREKYFRRINARPYDTHSNANSE
jgi:ribosome-associated heat shock protein Hsp15